MARRESTEGHRHFKFPFTLRLPKTVSSPCLPQIESPVSPVDVITRSVQSMKRFFSTSSKESIADNDNPTKRPRLRKSTIATAPRLSERVTNMSDVDSFVSPVRNKRNGIVFDDITVLSCNVDLARSNTLPTRKSTALNLSDIDFTQPPPEWITTARLHTSHEQQRPTAPFTSAEIKPMKIEPTIPDCHIPATRTIDFLIFSEFFAMKDTTSISLSALPSQPGFLRDTLFNQITTALDTIIDRAENGLQLAWNTTNLVVPPHFPDSILFVAESCDNLSKTLTAEPIQPGDVSEITRIFRAITKIAVTTAKVLDALEARNLVSMAMRLNCLKNLTKTVDRLISAARQVPVDVQNSLESITGLLDASVPGSLLKCRFNVYQTLINFILQASCQLLVSESAPLAWRLNNWTQEKLDRYIGVLKKVSKQLDRIGLENITIVKSPQRENILRTNDLKVDMLMRFSEAATQDDSKMKFKSLRLTSEIAKLVREPQVEAESYFCMANLIISKGLTDTSHPVARSLLLAAKSLNSSPHLQTKVQLLLTRLRRRTISSILEMAAEVQAQHNILDFEDAVKIFVRILLARYPSEGINPTVVMEGDLGRGLLRVVRVFHPDKNRAVDEEGRWICEEITKILNKMIERYRELHG